MMLTRKYSVAIVAFILVLILLLLPIRPASADNVFDRIKSIYNTPEQLEQMQQQYADNLAMMERELELQRQQAELHRQQLEESRRQADEMLQRQAMLQEQQAAAAAENEALAAHNELLANKLEQAERERQLLIRRIVLSIGTLAAITLAYTLSIRLWRFAAWRRHSREHTHTLTLEMEPSTEHRGAVNG